MNGMTRSSINPILSPEDVTPSAPGFRVIGIFNCGTVRYDNEVLLLCRVAESVKKQEHGKISIPVLSEKSDYCKLVVESFSIDDPQYSFHDSRSIRRKDSGRIERLTSISHFRLARSPDGINFILDRDPCLFPSGLLEEWGMEDPRITFIEGSYHIVYSSICRHGVSVSLITTKDFSTFIRRGIILPPTNKDAVLFPEKINGRYLLLHRPVPSDIGGLNIWIAESDNLTDWGNHRLLYESGSAGGWEENRVGVGTPPVLTEKGWLLFYHGVDDESRYAAGVLLLDRLNPCRILAVTKKPVLYPEMDYETSGFFTNVIFPCGLVEEKNGIRIYYGAADDKICTAHISWESLWEVLDV